MTNLKQVRVGIIGVGGMGSSHCKKVKEIRGAKLIAVVDIDPKIAEKVGRENKVAYFTDHKDLIKSGLCDAVAIVTPHPFHADPAIDCIKKGIHVLCEKPLTERVSTADKILAAARKYKVVLGIDFPMRLRPYSEKAIQIVRQGKIGKIYRATMIAPNYRTQAYFDSAKWRATWKGEGGGVLLNQLPHMLDIFLLLTGLPSEVYGVTETRIHDIEVEDLAEALLRFPDGGSGYIYASTNEPKHGFMIELFGDKGKLILRDNKLEFFKFSCSIEEYTKTSTETWGSVELKPVNVPFQKKIQNSVWKNFIDHILKGTELKISGESGLASLEVANAIALSSAKKKWVKLPINRRAYDMFLDEKQKKSSN